MFVGTESGDLIKPHGNNAKINEICTTISVPYLTQRNEFFKVKDFLGNVEKTDFNA